MSLAARIKDSALSLGTDLHAFAKAHPVFVVLLGLAMLTRLDTIVSAVLAFVIPVAILGLPVVGAVWVVRALHGKARQMRTIAGGYSMEDTPSLYQHRHIGGV